MINSASRKNSNENISGSIYIPCILRDSRLMQLSQGFAIYSDLPSSKCLIELRKEAFVSLQKADQEKRCRSVFPGAVVPTFEEDRKTAARIKRLWCVGGPSQQLMYHDSRLLEFLSLELGLRLRPSGSRGGYVYYVRSGDFIGVHRDAGACDLVLITVLYDSLPLDDRGAVVLYPGRITEPCKAISMSVRRGGQVIKLRTGQSLFMLGGVIPHRIVPVRAGQIRIISALCYSIEPTP